MTPERLADIEEMAKGDRWICDNGLCDYVDELVKALREAREEWAYEWEQRHQMEVKLLATEAEVEMLRGVGCGELREGSEVADGPCGACLKCARRERDEARAEAKTVRDFYLDRIDELRAEVKQLRGLLKTIWEDACEQEAGFLDEVCDAVEAALKEGE